MGTNHWALIAVHLPSHHMHFLDGSLKSDHAEYILRINYLSKCSVVRAWTMKSDRFPGTEMGTHNQGRLPPNKQTRSTVKHTWLLSVSSYKRMLRYASLPIWPDNGDLE